MQYSIPAVNISRLESQVESLNKRARKLGLSPLVLNVGERTTKLATNKLGFETEIVYFNCTIEGQCPKINGWRLVGIVEPQPSGENLLKLLPNETCPVEYRTTTMICDHCKKLRRRSRVCILAHDRGHFLQVGKNCLKDFLDHNSPDYLLSAAELTWTLSDVCASAESDDWGWVNSPRYIDLHSFLTTVVIATRRLGWVPRHRGENGGATADLAWDLSTRSDMSDFVKKHKLVSEPKDQELAAKAIAWAQAIDKKSSNDYLYNLGVATRLSAVNHQNCGLVASAIVAYERAIAQQIAAAGKIVLGTVGVRQVFENLTVQRMQSYPSYFGAKYLYRFVDPNGNQICWWSSKELEELTVGSTHSIKATVKRHSEFMGGPQTEVARVKLEKK